MESGQLVQINKFASQALTARSNAPTSSGPSEFTKRKNWSQNVLEELRDVVHVLSQDLNILYCSPASREFLGYQPGELMGRSFTEFMHVDDVDIYNREFHTAQSNSSILRVTYRFMRKDGKYTTLETRGHFFKNAFFGSARSVPTEMTRMMDTFLDYKMENEILKQKVAAAKAKAQQGRAASKKPSQQEPSPAATMSNTPGSSSRESFGQSHEEFDEDDFEDEFEELFAQSENVYTQGVLNSYNVNESVSLFTGLHFDMGERSRGISMGLEGELFNTLVAPSIGEEGGAANETVDKLKSGKKRRNEDDSERMCTDCGRTGAPEWRKGPKGPKTLCNACGLRWAKNNKMQE